MLSLKNKLIITDNIDEARERLFILENSGDGSSFFMGKNPGVEVISFDKFVKNEVSYYWKVLNEISPYEMPIFVSYSEAISILSLIVDKAKVSESSFFGLRIFSSTMSRAIFRRVDDLQATNERTLFNKLMTYFDIKSYIHPATKVNEEKLSASIMCYENFFRLMFDSSILDDSMAKILFYMLIQDDDYIKDFKKRYREIEFINPSRYMNRSVLKVLEDIVSIKIIDEKNPTNDAFMDIFRDFSPKAKVKKFELYGNMIDYVNEYTNEFVSDSITVFESFESKILNYRMDLDFGERKYKSIFDDIYGMMFLTVMYRMKNYGFFGDDFKYFSIISFIRGVDRFSDIIELKAMIEKGSAKNSKFKEEFLDESLGMFFDADFKELMSEMKDYPDEVAEKVAEIVFNSLKNKNSSSKNVRGTIKEARYTDDNLSEGGSAARDTEEDVIGVDDSDEIDRLKIFKKVINQYLHFVEVLERLDLESGEEIYLLKNILEKSMVMTSDIDISKRINIIRNVDINFKLPKGRVLIFDYTNPSWDNKDGDFIGEILSKRPSKREKLVRYLKKNQTNIDELVVLASQHSVDGYEQDRYFGSIF